MLKFYKENGLEKTKIKYRNIFRNNDKDGKQISIFKF